MVEALLQPLNIFLLGLGGGFLIPLLNRIARPLPVVAFGVALTGITFISATQFWAVLGGRAAIDIFTAGAMPPFSINLRFGIWEGFASSSVNIVAMLGAWHLRERLRPSYAALLLYLIVIMGINGMIMTRDLFNLFVFLEIVSIGTYGLFGLEDSRATLAASLKYIIATVLASSFFLLGTALLYHVTGTLNIDALLEKPGLISGPIAATALLLLLSCLIVELKPFPANGWGLDVYETAPSGIAALVSVSVSAGVFFALFKLMPLFENHLDIIEVSACATFLLSNLVGLRQRNVQRLLGYSSIAQMGLLTLALALLWQLGASDALPLVVGGIFINHLFAKAGLFWLAGIVNRREVEDWHALARRPFALIVFAVLVVAIAGLPPFPGFWAKWELVVRIAGSEYRGWIALILVGSLLEAAYMFRWFQHATRAVQDETSQVETLHGGILPSASCAILLAAGGYVTASMSGVASPWLFAPLCVGAALYVLDGLSGHIKCWLMLATVLLAGFWIVDETTGLNRLFTMLLLAGGVVVAAASLYRADNRPGFHALTTILLLAIAALLRASTSLEFFFSWELISLSSYFLVLHSRAAYPYALPFLLFSLVAAFFVLAGFAVAAAANGTPALAAFSSASADAWPAFLLLGIGFLVKAGAVGVHVWLPGAYAEADDDVSAMLSAVVSKVAIFGLFAATYLAIRSGLGLELAHVMGWIGLLTTLAGAGMALQQDDVKRMLAYSSMSQLGYIITAIALMSHLGWVTALYLVANHLMVKGILFVAVAGLVLRAGTRRFDELGGLARNMPFTFAAVVVALISMSGLPPLAGFGGKWLLLSAMVEKEWYWLAVLGVLATFVGFLYMFKFGYMVFFGSSRPELEATEEAPLALLVPQYVLIGAILVLSFLPKLLMDPVSAAIDPTFASTLVWQGMSLETIYGYWNPFPVMAITVAIAGALFVIVWLRYRFGRRRGGGSGVARFYAYYKPLLAPLVTPLAYRFWNEVSELTLATAGRIRMIYTGNGQTYALYVLCYVGVLCLIGLYRG